LLTFKRTVLFRMLFFPPPGFRAVGFNIVLSLMAAFVINIAFSWFSLDVSEQHVLYCTVLYCTVLYSTVLYCTVLDCTVLYCSVQYCAVLCCSARVKMAQ